MTLVKRIVGTNLVILVIYTLLANLTRVTSGKEAVGVYMAMAVSIHVIFCTLTMLFCFIRKKRSHGEAWLLATGVVLVVGFSACYGSSAI